MVTSETNDKLTPRSLNDMLAESYPAVFATGFRCVELGDGWSVARWTHDPEGLRPGGYIPGPVQFGLADLALWFAIFTVIGVELMAVTTDLAISFLRPAVGGDLMARSDVIKVGKTRIHGEVQLWVDGDPDRLVSRAHGQYNRP